ncbi:MAG: TlpA family protein disulfide reductase [Chitinophagaceae bacterium]
MKKLMLAIMLFAGFSIFANAQNENPKVIALLTKASWCPVCQANGPRFEKDIMPMVMENKDVEMVMNDLSDDNSKKMSKDMLEKAGVYKFAEKNNATGMLYFLDSKTKKLISKVSLANSDEEIKKALEDALSKS